MAAAVAAAGEKATRNGRGRERTGEWATPLPGPHTNGPLALLPPPSPAHDAAPALH